MALMGCQNSSPCPDLGDTCLADQSRFELPAASLACECSLSKGIVGAWLDGTVTNDVWTQQIDGIGGTVTCINDDAQYNPPSGSMESKDLIHHVQLPAGACCGEWIDKLQTTFGEHLKRAGASTCGDFTLHYPFGAAYLIE